jgi:DNA-directed RNA polymerase I, II, and III subunit RPABC1
MSINIEYNSKEINVEVCRNILIMLFKRKLLNNYIDTFNEILKDINDKDIIEFKLNNDDICNIFLYNTKLTSIVNGSPIDDFLSNNTDVHKIVVIKDFTKKVIKQINEDYKNAEVFFEYEMIEDISSKIFIPEHIILNQKEKDELLTKFNENELAIILSTDMMSRYYNAKIGDIFKIIRCNVTSGKSAFYRRVKLGSYDILFG